MVDLRRISEKFAVPPSTCAATYIGTLRASVVFFSNNSMTNSVTNAFSSHDLKLMKIICERLFSFHDCMLMGQF